MHYVQGIYIVYNTLKLLKTKNSNSIFLFIVNVKRRTEATAFKGNSLHLDKGYYFQLQALLLICLFPYLQDMKV